jgi:hypothetical protein
MRLRLERLTQHRRELSGHDKQFLKPLGYRFATYELEDTLGLGTDFLSYAEPGRLTEYYMLAEAMSGSHPHVTGMIEATRRTTAPIVDDLTLVDMPAWSQDCVVLLGDAAHRLIWRLPDHHSRRAGCAGRHLARWSALASRRATPDLNAVPNIDIGTAHEIGTHIRAHAQRPPARRCGAG